MAHAWKLPSKTAQTRPPARKKPWGRNKVIDQHRQSILNNHAKSYSRCIRPTRFSMYFAELPSLPNLSTCSFRRGRGGGGRDSRSPPRSGCLRGHPLETGGVVLVCFCSRYGVSDFWWMLLKDHKDLHLQFLKNDFGGNEYCKIGHCMRDSFLWVIQLNPSWTCLIDMSCYFQVIQECQIMPDISSTKYSQYRSSYPSYIHPISLIFQEKIMWSTRPSSEKSTWNKIPCFL